MINRLVPAVATAVGLFLLVAAVAAAVAHASVPAVAFGALGLVHLAVAFGVGAGSRLAVAAGVVVGAINLALLGFGIWFIAGIETGIGVDLGAAWFAPLNGYATIVVAALLGAASFVLVVGGTRLIPGRATAA